MNAGDQYDVIEELSAIADDHHISFAFLKGGLWQYGGKLKLSEIHHHQELSHLLSNTASASIAIINADCQLIPLEWYSPESTNIFAKHLPLENKSGILRSFSIPEFELAGIFTISQQLFSSCVRLNTAARFTHFTELYINQLGDILDNVWEDGLYVHILNNWIYSCGFEHNKLVFSNAYRVGGNADILYYVLAIMNICQWDARKIPLFLTGDISTDDDLYKLLWRYVKNVSVLKQAKASGLIPAGARWRNGQIVNS